jgi:ABC-type transporter Mla subunit MlaD
MARHKKNEIAVGLTVIVVLALTVTIVTALGDWSHTFSDEQEITVKLPYQTGLKGLTEGSPVFLGGAKIGQVTETGIESKPADSGQTTVSVYFRMFLPADYPLRDDCVFLADSNLLGGQVSLVIKDLGADGELLTDGQSLTATMDGGITQTLETFREKVQYEFSRDREDSFLSLLVKTAENLERVSGKIDQQMSPDGEKKTLMAKVHKILEQLNHITDTVNYQFSPDSEDGSIAKLNRVLDSLSTSLGQIDQLIDSNKTDITETVRSLKTTAKHLEKELPDMIAALKPALAKADAVMDQARNGLAHFKSTMQSTDEIMSVNRGRIDSLIANFQQVSSTMKLTSSEIRRAPWRLLYKPKKDERQLQQLVDAAGNFATAAERLDNATLNMQTALKAATSQPGADLSVDPSRLSAMIADLEAGFTHYKNAEDKFWNEIK